MSKPVASALLVLFCWACADGSTPEPVAPFFVVTPQLEVLRADPLSGALESIVPYRPDQTPLDRVSRVVAAGTPNRFFENVPAEGSGPYPLAREIRTYHLNPENGSLVNVAVTELGRDDHEVAVDPAGRFLFVRQRRFRPLGASAHPPDECPSSGLLHVFAITDGGRARRTGGAELLTLPLLRRAALAGNFVYVPAWGVSTQYCTGPGGVSAFHVAPGDGVPVVLPGSPFLVGHRVHAAGVSLKHGMLYVAHSPRRDESPFQLTMVTLAADGSPERVLDSAELPSGTYYKEASQVWVDPQERFVFVATSGVYYPEQTSHLWGFRIEDGGWLTYLPEASALDIVIDVEAVAGEPSGRFLYIGNSFRIAGFEIDGENEALWPLPGSPYHTETDPFRYHGRGFALVTSEAGG